MIQINKKPCPPELTNELAQKLTDEFIRNGTSVWKQSFIERTLLESSHNKCCYCECKIDEESKYMEVEHFKDKHDNPSFVVEWDNLLPSCKRCNGCKGTHNVIAEPIINPAVVNPRDHLTMWGYWYRSKTELGESTISVLDLNEIGRLVNTRFELAQCLLTQIELLLELTQEYDNGTHISTRRKNRIISSVRMILNEATPTAEYAATIATELVYSKSFSKIITIMKRQSLWDSEFEDLFTIVSSIAFEAA